MMKLSQIAPFFDHVDTWVFDLDNTLYNPGVRLFDQIEERMRRYICTLLDTSLEHADVLRAQYWRDHGTTLAGLMTHHRIDPMHFLDDVHDIDFSGLSADGPLAKTINALPGRKIVYTNGDKTYAARVLAGRGLTGCFEALFGIEDADFVPKPARGAFETVFEKAGIQPARAAMFEDEPRNLAVPDAMGLNTVLVHTQAAPQPHIHHHTQDLTRFLSHLKDSSLP